MDQARIRRAEVGIAGGQAGGRSRAGGLELDKRFDDD